METKKWEYKTEGLKVTYNDSDLIKFLNEQGNEGWELVDIDQTPPGRVPYFSLLFKREIVEI